MGRKSALRAPRPIFLAPARGRRLFVRRQDGRRLLLPLAILLLVAGLLVLLEEPLAVAAAVGAVVALVGVGLVLRLLKRHA